MSPWKIHSTAPILAPGQLHGKLDTRRAGAAHIVRIDDKYRMAYWGTDADGGNHILAAESPVERPNDWTPLGPMIGPQPESELNNVGPSFPILLPVDERRWLLYFCAWGRHGSKRLPNTTGVAISDDAGKTWRYHDTQPMLPLDKPYDREGTGSLWVEREGGRFRMWYTAIGRYFARPEGIKTGHGDSIPAIGLAYAESRDGLTWEKPLEDLVVRPRGFGVEPYEYICSKPSLLRNADGSYTLWLNTFGTAYRVHRLSSRDGLRWEWLPRLGPEGELGTGVAGSFDDHQRSYPVVLRHGDELRCWYTRNNFGTTGMGYATAGG
jgi:hypothetical protein